ncbi:disease resistance protein RPV1-like [Eucalyptus grandis]|uniref:disease resistance protein RPV1-like n=1 Tax=Eucalyptus grandis TaxID=71139 RepID=UPI00192E77BE|nr:disease resistance protein RPV1-like [Eucalyptus grandis]XP_039154696.1 disease resistance protein RPV1-like [Eucalyptus grandis]XP_039154697.1 disease resistance protein RPV1-like [Eucalyptus grandis]XP_039154698.1 disease resistance protein RPV1-like [Eucalyptus grandis]XP_039154699.1 disease resistance protein RPV1-like [Eucalyptus grandis]XP_039154700.1 disease resistance protein RPV1-like [Eucalyptus grandis]XP_039154701.1 disease resistance protein RPV1-like [Eucalyptus grandis]XP_0
MERSAKRPQGDQARSVEWDAKRRHTGGNDGTAGGASSTHTSTEGQEVVTSSGYDYEVFLSFRGPDTRADFTDFLYTSLNDAGIRTFKDDEELRIGEEFAPELLRAIKQSKISVPIFSKGYASSVWCLKELVQMVECKKTQRQKIMPIFYDVAPSEVRYQTGGYKEAFRLHEEKQRYSKDTICEWKTALSAVGAINGWDLHSKTDRREGEFAREVTHKVFTELKKAYLAVSECLVSVDNHVDAIMEMIGAGTSETRIVGIHGMGGIGKTTTAKMIYNKLSDDFDKCCFLQDIRETSKGNGIQYLQAQLISDILKMKRVDIKDIHEGTRMIKDRLSNKRVLLLLDDVEEANHINALVGKRDWLGKGSKIIITTRKKDILEVPEVDCSYELSAMDVDQSLQLFSKHAFRKDYPLDKYIGQSKRVIGIAGGLPLALEIIGSLLCHTKREMWDLTLKKLENVPHAAVQSKLKISYDALEVRQQDIFLDIACLFIGYNKDILVHFWDENKFPEEAMEVLQNMSLIKIEENNRVSMESFPFFKDKNRVWMHDQLRDLGREIVRQESKLKIEKQSRVWDPKEACDLLRRPEVKKKVEALYLQFDHGRHHFTYESFKSLSNLKFLAIDDWMEFFSAEERLLWHESSSNVLPIDVFQENSDLLPQLRWLSWPIIPLTFKITKFSMEHVVILDLSHSKITHDWKGWSHMKVMKNLKVMDLTLCRCLERSPDFSAHSKLEYLILRQCHKLVEIDMSICQLKSLVFLDAICCENLRRLPDEMGRDLASLKYLYLFGCRQLERLPNTIGNLKSLIELDIKCSGIKELPDALWTIEKLEVIKATNLFDCEICNCISKNRSLRILRLSGVRLYVVPRLPESLNILELKVLYMDTFPDLSNLTNLEKLMLSFSRRDCDGESDGPVEENPMPLWIGNLSKLEYLSLTCPFVTTVPIDMRSLLPQLKTLELWCPKLRCLSSLPSCLSSLWLGSAVTSLPTDMSSLLPRLGFLLLECPNLRCLPSLPSSLSEFRLWGFESGCSMEFPSSIKTLPVLYIRGCAISEFRGFDRLENLKDLLLWELQQVEILPDLSNLNKLESVDIRSCYNLVEIQGELPPLLGSLTLQFCGSLQKLPDLSSLKKGGHITVRRCGKLNVEAISLLCLEKGVRFEVDFSEKGVRLEGEDDESEGEDDESEGEDDESEGEDDESEGEDDESEGEDDESGFEFEIVREKTDG